MLKVWGRRSAYNVQKVLWTLGELGLTYEHFDVGSVPGQLNTLEFLAMNPHGRIPVLADEDVFIWESNTIVRYLSAVYGTGMLWSVDPLQRSFADRWMDWEVATLQADFLQLFWNYFRTPESQRDEASIERAAARCETHFRLLDHHLGRFPFLAGESFSMGDIPCATTLYRYFEMGIKVPPLPNVQSWYQRLASRNAYRENIMISFESLRGRQRC